MHQGYRGCGDFVIMHYNRGGEYLDLSHVLYNAFASDSALIFQQFMGMTAPKRRGMSDIPHNLCCCPAAFI